ncbi:MAG: biotin/lipoyl-containing protein [Bacteroidota bacterium]
MPSQENQTTNKDYLVHIGERSYEVDEAEVAQLDLIESKENHFHLIHNDVGYEVEFRGVSADGKLVYMRVNERDYQAKISDKIDQLVQQMGLNTLGDQTGKDVFSPMPGLILDVLVVAGQEIEAGTPLLILEAMKMENVIKADGSGTVKTISIERGQAVDKRQLLIEIE